jgi:hypothetical protein
MANATSGIVKFSGYKGGGVYKAKGAKNKRKMHKEVRRRREIEEKIRIRNKIEAMHDEMYNS